MSIRGAWECGRHSNIPVCCRVWWIYVFRPLRLYRLYRLAEHWGYVACPICIIIQRRREVYPCNCYLTNPNVWGLDYVVYDSNINRIRDGH